MTCKIFIKPVRLSVLLKKCKQKKQNFTLTKLTVILLMYLKALYYIRMKNI